MSIVKSESLEFVEDRKLREILESDLTEMSACLEAAAYKATTVLAGSIVEAVLIALLVQGGEDEAKSCKLPLSQLVDKPRQLV